MAPSLLGSPSGPKLEHERDSTPNPDRDSRVYDAPSDSRGGACTGRQCGGHSWSPRVNALFRLTDGSNLRFGWGQYRQTQGIADLAALDGLGRYFPSERSKQWTLGYEQVFRNGALRVEAYHKKGANLRPIFGNWKGSPDVFPESNEDRILVYPENTTAKGIEVYLSQDISRKISLRGSYALALADEQVSRIDNVNDPTPLQFDPTHPTPQDQRHAVNLDLTYRANTNWTINASYAFHTGWPATLESLREVTGSDGEPDVAIKPNKIYGSRLPDYHRVDVRATKRVRAWGGNLRFFFEVTNLTNHSNVFGYDYYRVPDANGGIVLRRDSEKWFIILPSLGISWNSRF